jgi:hypothetical protein
MPSSLEMPEWVDNPPETPEEIALLLEKEQSHLTEKSKRGEALRLLLRKARSLFDSALISAKKKYPIAFFKPSYEQALLLNCWVWGINFPLCFSANRIGKTVAFVVNALLWIFPNNPQWVMFKPYIDHLGRLVAIIPRPSLTVILPLQDYLYKNPHLQPFSFYKQPYEQENATQFATLQNLFFKPCYPKPPIDHGGMLWLGAPDHDWHRHTVMRRWKDWLPSSSIIKWNTTDCHFTITTGQTAFEIDCKSYDSEATKWSGDAVQGIILTEGFPQDILDEVKQRIVNDGFMSWDYTPAEPRNTGKKVRMAYKVVKGEEPLPLRSFPFMKFSVRTAPEHILPKEKREDMIRMWANREEGRARIDGDFYASSGLVLDKLDRNFHCLDWSLQDLFSRYPDGRFYRGIDPGFDHPTSCCWGYLSYNNIWFIYRFYSERARTIPERCADIIKLSNNARQSFKRGNQVFWREIHPYPNSEVFTASPTDYHIFKTDENTGLCYANSYMNEGLAVTESTHTGPEERAQQLNRLLDPHAFPYLSHPRTEKPPGAKVFFLINQPGVPQALDRLEELFWDRYKRGDLAGEPKDKVPDHGDDELDALCSLTSSPYVWTTYQPRRIEPLDSEPEILQNFPQKKIPQVAGHFS